MRLKVLVMILCCFVINEVRADPDQIYDRAIIKIATYRNYAIIYFSPDFPSTQGCASGSNNSGVIRFENAEKREMYSMALAAATAQSNQVGFGVNGCDTNDSLNRPIIYRIETSY